MISQAVQTVSYRAKVQAILDSQTEDEEEESILDLVDTKKVNEIFDILAKVGGMSATLFALLYGCNHLATKSSFNKFVKV